MEKLAYSIDDGWGMTYIFQNGYKRVTSNINNIGRNDEDWIARFYYADSQGNIFLSNKKGRTLKIEINSEVNFYSDCYLISIRDEIKKMSETKDELNTVCSELEKMVMKKNKSS